MVGLAYFMISDVPYPAVPTVGYKSARQIVGTSIILGSILGLIFLPREFIFPALVAYVLFGAVKWAFLGFLDRAPDRRSVFLEEEADVDPTLAEDLPEHESVPGQRALPAGSPNGEDSDNAEPTNRRRRRRRRGRGDRPNPPTTHPKHEDRGP
jgi:hypothetical protein